MTEITQKKFNMDVKSLLDNIDNSKYILKNNLNGNYNYYKIIVRDENGIFTLFAHIYGEDGDKLDEQIGLYYLIKLNSEEDNCSEKYFFEIITEMKQTLEKPLLDIGSTKSSDHYIMKQSYIDEIIEKLSFFSKTYENIYYICTEQDVIIFSIFGNVLYVGINMFPYNRMLAIRDNDLKIFSEDYDKFMDKFGELLITKKKSANK